jgi:hypothetical protein
MVGDITDKEKELMEKVKSIGHQCEIERDTVIDWYWDRDREISLLYVKPIQVNGVYTINQDLSSLLEEYNFKFDSLLYRSVEDFTVVFYNDGEEDIDNNYPNEENEDKYHYLLDLADSYEQDIKKLEDLQKIGFSEYRQAEIDRLTEKWHKILADYEKFSLEDKGENER